MLVAHLETFLDRATTEEFSLPRDVENELRDYVKCGVLAHAYFGIDDDILWDIVTNKIPDLKGEVETYLLSH